MTAAPASVILAPHDHAVLGEALWRAGILPTKQAGKVTGAQLARLVPAIRAVLEASIRDGGSTLLRVGANTLAVDCDAAVVVSERAKCRSLRLPTAVRRQR